MECKLRQIVEISPNAMGGSLVISDEVKRKVYSPARFE